MGLFNKLFGKPQLPHNPQKLAETQTVQFEKGDRVVSSGDNYFYKVNRPITEEQREHIDKSTILLRTGQVYMHYWTDDLVCEDPNDQEWLNKVIFFWKAEEPFPMKSLPSAFETFKTKFFLFSDTSKLTLQAAQVKPWFGMPGLGMKNFCEMNGLKVTVPELNKLGFVEYIEHVELANDNLNILTDRENYFFLIDERFTPFKDGSFYLKDKPISIDLAYSIGGIRIVKRVT